MSPGGFEFELEVTSDGTLVGRIPASLAACFEDALFREIASGRHPNDGTLPPLEASPVWDEDPPAVRAVALRIGATGATAGRGDAAATTTEYPRDVFHAQALGCITDLLKTKAIDAKAEVTWRVVARPEPPPEERPLRARVSRSPMPIEIGEVPDAREGELVAEIDEALVERFRDAYRAAGNIERAWLLTGHVYNEPARAATAVRIADAVAVETGLGGASQSHFHFAPAALVRARNVARRQAEGTPVGWLHTHPACEACQATPECRTDMRFFSSSDVEVHTTAFPSPFMVGLVVAKAHDRSVAEPGVRAYGWSGARVGEIPLRVVAGATARRAAEENSER